MISRSLNYPLIVLGSMLLLLCVLSLVEGTADPLSFLIFLAIGMWMVNGAARNLRAKNVPHAKKPPVAGASEVIVWLFFVSLVLLIAGLSIWIPTASRISMGVIWVGSYGLLLSVPGAVIAMIALGFQNLKRSRPEHESHQTD